MPCLYETPLISFFSPFYTIPYPQVQGARGISFSSPAQKLVDRQRGAG